LKKKKKDTKTATIELLKLDLSDLALVREFAIEYCKKYTRLDILILNAGVVNSSLQLSKQNLELMFAVNHLGHFLLTNLLLPKMKSSAPSRIVVVASEAHKFSPVLSEDLKELKEAQEYGLTSSMSIYGRSKLCNILFALELDQKLASEDGIDGDTSKSSKPRTVTVNSLHPGTVDTELGRDTPWYLSWIVKPISSLFFLRHQNKELKLPFMLQLAQNWKMFPENILMTQKWHQLTMLLLIKKLLQNCGISALN